MAHYEIKCETECIVSVKAEPLEHDFDDGTGTAQLLCVTEMKVEEPAKNNMTEQHCIAKLEPVKDDMKGSHRKEDKMRVRIKREGETECKISVKTEPVDDDFEEGTAQALCVAEMRIDDSTTERIIDSIKLVKGNTKKEIRPQGKDKSSKKRKPRRVKRDADTKRHECKICHKYLSGISSLKAHYRTHTGEKPYECNICTHKFAQKAHLVMHIRTHTGGKPYECHICQTRFSQKINLQRHCRSHKGEKPYECKICKNRFTRKSALLRHSSLHQDGS